MGRAMSDATRHNRFTTVLQSMNLRSLDVLRQGLEQQRIEAIAHGNGEHLRFCDERLKIIELELARREADDAR